MTDIKTKQTIQSQQEQFKNVEDEEKVFHKTYPYIKKIDSSISNSENTLFWPIILCAIIISNIIWSLINGIPNFGVFITITSISYILGGFFYGLFLVFLKKKYDNYLFKKYNTNEIEYQDLIKKRTDIRKRKRSLETDIAKSKKTSYLNDLTDSKEIDVVKINKTNITKQTIIEKANSNKNRQISKTASNSNEKIKPDTATKSQSNPVSSAQINQINKEEEKDISQLVSIPIESNSNNNQESKVFRVTPKTDFEKLNIHRHSIGKLGEEFVYEEEKRKLRLKGLEELSNKVKWISRESDSYGYDIISFFEDGTPKYIEVKTTTSDIKTHFYLSEVELAALNKMENYQICRIYNFNVETGDGAKYIVSKEQITNYFNLEPISYKVNPKF